MWDIDNTGYVLPGDTDALSWLRERAREIIRAGSLIGSDDRQVSRRVRLRSDTGKVLFEGTLEEAANIMAAN